MKFVAFTTKDGVTLIINGHEYKMGIRDLARLINTLEECRYQSTKPQGIFAG